LPVCFVWPSACAVRATWLERTFANASVGGLPVGIGGLLPGDEPVPEATGVEAVVTGALEVPEPKPSVALVPDPPDGVPGPLSDPLGRIGAALMLLLMPRSCGESR
jgi:hypothetical protein